MADATTAHTQQAAASVPKHRVRGAARAAVAPRSATDADAEEGFDESASMTGSEDVFQPPGGPAPKEPSPAELAAMSPEQLLCEFRILARRADGFRRAHDSLKKHLTGTLQPLRIATLQNRITELEGHLRAVLGENKTLTAELRRLDKDTPERAAERDLTDALTRQAEQMKYLKDKLRDFQAHEHDKDLALRRSQQQRTALETLVKELRQRLGEDASTPPKDDLSTSQGSGGRPGTRDAFPSLSPASPQSRGNGGRRDLTPIRGGTHSTASPSGAATLALSASPTLSPPPAPAGYVHEALYRKLQAELTSTSRDNQRLSSLLDRVTSEQGETKAELDEARRLLNKQERMLAIATATPGSLPKGWRKEEMTLAQEERELLKKSRLQEKIRTGSGARLNPGSLPAVAHAQPWQDVDVKRAPPLRGVLSKRAPGVAGSVPGSGLGDVWDAEAAEQELAEALRADEEEVAVAPPPKRKGGSRKKGMKKDRSIPAQLPALNEEEKQASPLPEQHGAEGGGEDVPSSDPSAADPVPSPADDDVEFDPPDAPPEVVEGETRPGTTKPAMHLDLPIRNGSGSAVAKFA